LQDRERVDSRGDGRDDTQRPSPFERIRTRGEYAVYADSYSVGPLVDGRSYGSHFWRAIAYLVFGGVGCIRDQSGR